MVAEKKIYILDTNVLVHDPLAIYQFKNTEIGIPSIVLEELDRFKTESTVRGRNSRETVRQLDALREKGSLRDGVKIDNGSIVRVIFLTDQQLPAIPFNADNADNKILQTAVAFAQQGYDVRFISKDINARVKADILGIKTEDYLGEHVTETEFYKGWVTVDVPAVILKKEMPPELADVAAQYKLTVNEYVMLTSQHNQWNYRLFRYLGGNHFKVVYEPKLEWPLKPKNPQQIMAMDLMLDDSIQFVTLFGPAGTGKTFLALLAGLHKVLIEDAYEKMLISRPVVPLGRDIGYLPGTVEEKLRSWMLPIYDNMEFIIHSAQMGQSMQGFELDQDRRKGKKVRRDESHHNNGALHPLMDLIKRNKVSLEAITYMRGRSIPYQFILIDEVQNLTPHEVKTLVSRVGEGSKIILTGDPYQIDSPYLDFGSNGLVVTSDKFKGQKIFGTVFLPTSERSELSKLVSELL
jgi:PhoH-like ATPase